MADGHVGDVLVSIIETARAGGDVIVLHGGSVATGWHAPWRSFIGATFVGHPPRCEMAFAMTAGAGVSRVWVDEPYVHRDLDPGNIVLATHATAHGVLPAAWWRSFGRGRMIYFSGGHDADVWKDPGFAATIDDVVAASEIRL